MAVEARHMNLFPPQLITNRYFKISPLFSFSFFLFTKNGLNVFSSFSFSNMRFSFFSLSFVVAAILSKQIKGVAIYTILRWILVFLWSMQCKKLHSFFHCINPLFVIQLQPRLQSTKLTVGLPIIFQFQPQEKGLEIHSSMALIHTQCLKRTKFPVFPLFLMTISSPRSNNNNKRLTASLLNM